MDEINGALRVRHEKLKWVKTTVKMKENNYGDLENRRELELLGSTWKTQCINFKCKQ